MKGFLNFFARWVVPVLGLLALSLIIWFLGPLLRLGNYEPLASATSRWVLIVLLFLVWIGFRVLRIVQARRNAAKVMQSLAEVSAPDAASVATAEELATSSNAWTRPWPCSSGPSWAAASGATCTSCPGT